MPRATHLNLDELVEEDISDSSPYFGFRTPASSTAASSITSSTGSLTTPTPARPSFSSVRDGLHVAPSLSRKKSLGDLDTPSSPVSRHARHSSLLRSATLPRPVTLEDKPRKRQAELDGLEMPADRLQSLRNWIIGIAIVDFDLDDGPVLDGVFPPLALTPTETQNISFSAFPDSSQFDQGSSTHSFRMREQLVPGGIRKVSSSKDGFWNGFAHFTQKRDPTSKRGYRQTSVVILTQHAFPALFYALVSIFGPLYQEHGIPMLEAACHNISSWQEPKFGSRLELGFLGSVLRLDIPQTIDEQQYAQPSVPQKFDPSSHILASCPPFHPPPILLFEASLAQLWSLWECLVLCEPILIFGPSPSHTSQAIWWLRDLLRPIPLAGDVRPYLTMQDGDHQLLVNKQAPKGGVVLGVTNPFFEKSCAHWPHVLSLGGRRMIHVSPAKHSASLGYAGPTPGWKSKTHKRYISKDRALLKELENSFRGNDIAKLNASLLVRRHFCSRTTAVLAPLARYLNTLIPSPDEVNSASRGHTLRLKPFNNSQFFASLKAHGSPLPFRSTNKRTEFYQRFLKTPAFALWLAQQEQVVASVLKDKRVPV